MASPGALRYFSTMKRYVLLDRDGTLIVDRHYLANPDGVELLPGVAAGLRQLRDLDFGLIVTTNQSGIARGYFNAATLAQIHERMRAMLAAEGVMLDGLYYCPHADEDQCSCRKPKPGMAEQAAQDHGFGLAETFVIGDREPDVGLARAIGVPCVIVRTGGGADLERSDRPKPDYFADDMVAAAEWIVGRVRH